MLQFIREKAKGWVALLLLGLVSVIFSLWGIDYYIKSDQRQSILAKVNGKSISFGEWKQNYHHLLQWWQVAHSGKAPSATEKKMIKHQAFTQLINRHVLLSYFHAQNYYIDAEKVQYTIKHMPQLQEKGNFSRQYFVRFLRYFSYSESEFIQSVHYDLIQKQFTAAIFDSAFLLPWELEQWLQLYNEVREVEYFELPINRVLSTPITREIIEAYYRTHQKQFIAPLKVQVAYLQLTSDDMDNQELFSSDSALSPESGVASKNNTALLEKRFHAKYEVIKKTWLLRKLPLHFTQAVEQLSELTYTHPKSLEFAASKLHLPIHKTDFFEKKIPLKNPSITQYPAFRLTAFNHDVIQGNNNSVVITLPDGSVVYNSDSLESGS